MSSVEASPVLMIESSEARCPSTRTMLVCGGKPSRTWATSRMKTMAPLLADARMGRSFSSSSLSGALLVSTWYSKGPILAVPEGRIRFCAAMVLTTSAGESPFDCSAGRSRSTCTCRCLPP